MGKPQTPGVISKKHYGFQFMINDISINVSMINTKCVLLKAEGLFLSWLKPFRDLVAFLPLLVLPQCLVKAVASRTGSCSVIIIYKNVFSLIYQRRLVVCQNRQVQEVSATSTS